MSIGFGVAAPGLVAPAAPIVRRVAIGSIPAGTLLRLFIAGVDYSAFLAHASFNLSDELGARNTCRFRLLEASLLLHFQTGEPCDVFLGGEQLFGGRIEQAGEVEIGEDEKEMVIDVECVDWNCLADQHLVAGRYEAGQTLAGVIQDIVDVQSGDIGETLKDAGVTLDSSVFALNLRLSTLVFPLGTTVAEALDDLAELLDLWWNIGHTKTLFFVSRQTYRAPKDLDVSTWREHTTPRMSLDRAEYRNIQLLLGGDEETVPESQIELFKGDGDTESFPLKFRAAVPKVGGVDKPPRVEVSLAGGAFLLKTIGVRGKDKDKDWYYKAGEKEITQDSSGATLGPTDRLQVTYTGATEMIKLGRDDEEIARRKAIEGGVGVDSHVETDRKIQDSDLGDEKVMALLRRYGRIPRVFHTTTFVNGFASGQLIHMNQPQHGAVGDYAITAVDATWIGNSDGVDHLQYNLELVEGEQLGVWTDFFWRLSTKGRPLILRDNQEITLIRQVKERFILQDTLSETDALGSYTTDIYSREMIGSSLGFQRQLTPLDPTPYFVSGPACGMPEHVGVS